MSLPNRWEHIEFPLAPSTSRGSPGVGTHRTRFLTVPAPTTAASGTTRQQLEGPDSAGSGTLVVMPPDSSNEYPLVPATHFVERRAIRRLTALLEDAGFLIQETAAHFDKGLDLLVAPTHRGLALPAIAAIQVRGGDSQLDIRTGRHARYWAEMTLPVFGAVVPESRDGAWVDLGAYLREHPTATSVTPTQALSAMPEALRAASLRQHATLSLIDLGAQEEPRQLSALLSLVPLRDRAEAVALVRSRLAHLGCLPARLALELLTTTSPSVHSAITAPCPDELALLADKAFKLSLGDPADLHPTWDENPIDSWRLGATYLWDLIDLTSVPASDLLTASVLTRSAEALDLLVFMGACRQPAAETIVWIEDALRRHRHWADNADLMTTLANLEEDPEGPALSFPRFF